MAYTHSKYTVNMLGTAGGQTLSCTASGDLSHWSPGLVPHIIRAVGIQYLTSGMTASALQVVFRHLALASGSTASAIGTLNGVSSDAAGDVVYYIVTGEVRVDPGEEVVFNVAAAPSGTCNVRPFLYVEPSWEQPANNTEMRATT